MSSPTPVSLTLKKQSRQLQVCWDDGSTDLISGQNLRRHCACSSCRSKRQTGVDLITDNSSVSEIVLMGTTGIQIIFADGHDRGVYPWAYLHAIAKGNAEEYLNT
jgi:DUF971 family protein